jgi:hypothetical protein
LGKTVRGVLVRLVGASWRVPKTLELGTIGYEPAIPGKAWKNMFINNIPKPVFRMQFRERV